MGDILFVWTGGFLAGAGLIIFLASLSLRNALMALIGYFIFVVGMAITFRFENQVWIRATSRGQPQKAGTA